MKTVVLDGYTLNPGDLSWDPLHALGECKVFNRTLPSELLHRSVGAEALLTNKTPLTRETIAQLPRLRYIGVLATGYNVVDIEAAAERGIPVTNVPTYGTDSVAQMVFAHILNLSNRVAQHDLSVKAGDWSRSDDFCYWNHPLFELAGRTLGIVGYGRIGRAVSRLGKAFGMGILAYDPFVSEANDPGVTRTDDLPALFRECDVVSLHAPLTPENEGFVDGALLSQMKRSALIINTSRGPLINETDLAKALNDEVIAGAGLDVLALEPPAVDNPLLGAKNCFITPHIAWATRDARSRLLDTAIENLRTFIERGPDHVINCVNRDSRSQN